MNEKIDKKQLKLTILAVVTLIALIAGATYAYFSVGTSNNFGTSTINATADSVGNVILQGSNANLTLNVTAVDMARGENNIAYYASTEGKKTTRTEEVVATATVSPKTDTNYYHCSYTLRVTQSYTGDKNMYNIFKGTQQVDNKTYTASENELILLVNGQGYDLQSNVLPKEIEGEFYIKGEQEVELKAGLQLNNLANKDQTLLAGSGVNLSIEVKAGTFTCTAEEEPDEVVAYYTYEGENVTGSTANKVSDYRNLNVYRRLDTSANRYYVYPTSSQATCESDNGGNSCESVTQPYFIKETSRSVTSNEPIYEVKLSQDSGSTYSTFENYTATELSDFETNMLGGTTLTCDGETETDLGGGTKLKCITHEAGYTYSQTSNEVCSNYGNKLICMKETDWENSETLKERFEEEAGLTCAYNNGSTWVGDTKPESGYLSCSDEDPTNGYNAVEFYCVVNSGGSATCRVGLGGYCGIGGGSAGCSY